MLSPDLQTLCDESGLHRELGLRIEHSSDGVIVRAVLDHRYAAGQTYPVVHGGIVASVLDTAATFVLIAKTEHDWVTVDLRVDYLRPTPLGSVEIWGEVIHVGKRLGRARSELRDATGRLCAIAVGTFAANRTVDAEQQNTSSQ